MNINKNKKTYDSSFLILVATIFIVILVALFATWASTSENLRIVKLLEVGAALLAASGVIISAYLTIKQSKEAVNQLAADRQHNDELRAQQQEKEQLEETFRLIEKWDDPHFLIARRFSREIGEIAPSTSAVELIKKINECQELKGSIKI